MIGFIKLPFNELLNINFRSDEVIKFSLQRVDERTKEYNKEEYYYYIPRDNNIVSINKNNYYLTGKQREDVINFIKEYNRDMFIIHLSDRIKFLVERC